MTDHERADRIKTLATGIIDALRAVDGVNVNAPASVEDIVILGGALGVVVGLLASVTGHGKRFLGTVISAANGVLSGELLTDD